MKLTPWFYNSTNPVRNGVYEVDTPMNLANKYAYYDKLGWRLCARNKQDALAQRNNILEMPFSSMNVRGSKWRGILK